MAAHSIVVITATSITIAVFLGLAVLVVSRNPRQSANWIFGLLCLTIAGMYFSSLFMVSQSDASLPVTMFFLRLKWLAIALSPTFFLHLVFFHFPLSWQRFRPWILISLYALSAGIGLAVLFTDLIVAGYHDHPPPHIVGLTPGPLVWLLAALFIVQVCGSVIGLIAGYFATESPPFRYQVLYLLIPTGLVLLSSTIHWIVLFMHADHIPHELPDALLIAAAYLYTRSIVRFGSITGQPVTRRQLFYAVLTAATGVTALYLALTLDEWLVAHSSFPLPPVTSLLILVFVAGFPPASRWITARLDPWLFRAEREQETLAAHLAEVLVETPDVTRLQIELLESLCAVLGVNSGYIAASDPASSLRYLTIQAVHGKPKLRPGDQIARSLLKFSASEPQIVTPALSCLQPGAGGRDMTLLCPLSIDQNLAGVLALGEKRDGSPFTPEDITLCTSLIQELSTYGQAAGLRQKYDYYVETARQQSDALQQLGEAATPSANPFPVGRTDRAEALAIHILGPMYITRKGQLVSESAWGSERAKMLLAYLLWRSPAGATREELCEILWPDRPPEDTANVFHVTLHRLRRVLQPPQTDKPAVNYIQHDRGRYRFNVDAPYWLDIEGFQELVARDDIAALRAAVNLYRGYYLEDAVWALPPDVGARQRNYEQLYADALRRLAAQTDGWETLIYLENLLVIEPTDETANRALVLGYLAQGRGDLARRQVTRWQQAVAEFEIEPSSEAIALWQRIESKGDGSS